MDLNSDDDSFELDPQEFIFVIDRSGSMYWGEKAIKTAKEALKLFLHSLPDGSYFNVVSFGSSYEYLFKESVVVPFNQENMTNAINEIEKFDLDYMDLGGTEIYEPLDSIFKEQITVDLKRQVFLLTDGQVHNTD